MLSKQASEMKNKINFGKDVFKLVHDFVEANNLPTKALKSGDNLKAEINIDETIEKLGVSKETLCYALSFNNILMIMEHLWSKHTKNNDEKKLPTIQQLIFETLALQSRFKTARNIPPMAEETTLADEIVADQFLNELDEDGLLLLSLKIYGEENKNEN